jgi:DNA-binding transcriptional ArsR family regulator
MDLQTDITINRNLGSETSREAFKRLRARSLLSEGRRLVLLALNRAGIAGLTAEEAGNAVLMGYTTVSARISELKKLGLVTTKKIGTDKSGRPVYEKRRTRSGSPAFVIVLTSLT